jgi:iron complex outermembrane receptor protein
MKSLMTAVLAGASMLTLASTATAQTAPAAAPAASAGGDTQLGEIVVTARRRSESLQEVPQTVNAVTADTLQKLNITQFTDVQNVVPGLSLQNSGNGYQSTASMRGVTFDVNTAAPLPTVAMYINDAPVQTSFLFNSLFDIGQVEVLRGPQGTTRGVSTPSGAITATFHKPDLSEFGGYFDGTLTDQRGRNAQGAINIPIIKDVLAIRAAAVVDETNGGGITSIHNNLRPKLTTSAERFTVSFEPSDVFQGNLMYQHLDRRFLGFDQLAGPGQGANPPISPFDRTSPEVGNIDARTHQDMVIANIDSRIFGQHLSYVGSYQHTKTHAQNLGTTNAGDIGDITGVPFYNFEDVGDEGTTHEIRLASDPAPGRFLDYTVGAFYSWQQNFGTIHAPSPLTLGAFGPPGSIDPTQFNPNYVLFNSFYEIPGSQQETSLFASVTLHLPWDTELSGGIRHMWTQTSNNLTIHTSPGLLGLGGVNIPLGSDAVLLNPSHASDTPNIYNVSLSHHFTRDLLGYVNTGTSYRAAFFSPGIQGPLATSTDPALAELSNHPAERSRSYEIGVKWTFWDGRARINADAYRQRFSNFTMYVPNVNYALDATGASFTNFAFTQPVDALVKGFELDAALQITREWNVGLQYSYADGKVQGSQVVCNTFNANGTPSFNHQYVSFCPGTTSSRLPYWNATLTSEYDHRINDGVDGFIRGLFNYFPENKNRMEPGLTFDSYGLLNLYAGVRSHDGAWEVSVFAKNALANDTVIDRSPIQASANSILSLPSPAPQAIGYLNSFPANSGYYVTQVTQPREVGINVKYAWGSR